MFSRRISGAVQSLPAYRSPNKCYVISLLRVKMSLYNVQRGLSSSSGKASLEQNKSNISHRLEGYRRLGAKRSYLPL